MKTSAKFISVVTVSVVALTAGLVSSATAATPGNRSISLENLARPSFIQERARISRPFAHVLFCKQEPEECVATPPMPPTVLTGSRIDELIRVNESTNKRVVSVVDEVTAMGADKWSLNPEQGDCEDYAITKRHELTKRGWPASTLHLASAVTPDGRPHMVLVVRTSGGDLVLDNLTDEVLPWNATGLRMQTIQSADPKKWFAV